MIYTVTLNPALDKTVVIPSLTVDGVNRISSVRTDPGGKGINVSKVIAALGEKSVATGLLGGSTGRLILAELEKMGMRTAFRFVEGETRTNIKIIDPVNHTNTDLNEPGIAVSKEVLESLLEELALRIGEGDIVVLSGRLPGDAPEDTYGVWTRTCRKAGAKVILDAEGAPLQAGILAAPYLIKPNVSELSALLGRELTDPDKLAGAAKNLRARYGIGKVVVSMGSAGALYVTESETIFAESPKVSVKSTVGAGDSMVAALAVAEKRGWTLEEAVRLSIACSAAKVMCDGSQAPDYGTIEKLLREVKIHRLKEPKGV